MNSLLVAALLLVGQVVAQNYGGYAAAGSQPASAAPAAGYEAPAATTPAPAAAGYDQPAPSSVAPAPVPQAGYGDQEASEAQGAAAEDETPKGPGPLPECYINDDGFLCCNKASSFQCTCFLIELEKLMSDTYDSLSKSRDGKWKKCNRHQVSVSIQNAATEKFKHDFEVVTGAGDYASKNNFDGNLLCKIKREKSIILAYGTPTF
ncbi:Ground-like domain protein [Aphelenchoides fujianensis]|nr:Ground-like domain protein [Aphelenchoides fujianensis]